MYTGNGVNYRSTHKEHSLFNGYIYSAPGTEMIFHIQDVEFLTCRGKPEVDIMLQSGAAECQKVGYN